MDQDPDGRNTDTTEQDTAAAANSVPPAAPSPEVQAALDEMTAEAATATTDAAKPAKSSKATKTRKKSPKSQSDASDTDAADAAAATASASAAEPEPATAKTASASAAGKKSPKVSRIVAIIVAILLVFALVGAALWYFFYYNHPDKIAYDAVSKLFTAENVGTKGEIILAPTPNESDSTINRIALRLDTPTNHLPATGTLNFAVDQKDDPDFDFDLEYVQLEDGVLYLKVDGIMAAIEAAGLDEDAQDDLTTTLELVDDIDGEWWEIAVVDLMKSLDMDRSTAEMADAVYTCAVDLAKGEGLNELGAIYDQHRFLTLEKVKSVNTDGHWYTHDADFGHMLYRASLNKRALADFINQLPETDSAETFADCYNTAVKDYYKDRGFDSRRYYESSLLDLDEIDEISAYDLDLPEELKFYLEISNWDHKLQRFILTHTIEDEINLSADLTFDYRKATVNPPSSYKPITDLVDDDRLEEAYYEIWEVQTSAQSDDAFELFSDSEAGSL